MGKLAPLQQAMPARDLPKNESKSEPSRFEEGKRMKVLTFGDEEELRKASCEWRHSLLLGPCYK
jgi:hypothetical protein